jgi:hypothetical protein
VAYEAGQQNHPAARMYVSSDVHGGLCIVCWLRDYYGKKRTHVWCVLGPLSMLPCAEPGDDAYRLWNVLDVFMVQQMI